MGEGKKEEAKYAWKIAYGTATHKMKDTSENLKQAYSVKIWQCMNVMRKDPKANSRYKQITKDQDVIELLKVICTIMYNYNYHKYQPEAIHEAVCCL